MNAHEVLVAARNLIADEENWTNAGVFCDGHGRYCATGALMRVAWDRDPEPSGEDPFDLPVWEELYDAMRMVDDSDGGTGSVNSWNDSHSHAEVLAAFDKAIASTAPQPDASFLAEVEEAIPA